MDAKEIRERQEERKDTKAQVAILRKADPIKGTPEELVDHREMTYDIAQAWAESYIQGKPDLKFKITAVI